MSRHRINVMTSHKNIGRVLQSNKIQCRDISSIDYTYRGNVATLDQSNLDSEISPMLRL